MSDSEASQYVGGKYQVLSALGSGGLGNVFLCQDVDSGKHVAVKRLKENHNLPAEVYEHTKREASVLSELRHRNVIKVYDLGIDQEGMYFVFEYVDGPTLAHVIKQGPMPLPAFFHMAFQILEGLGAAHRMGVLHLDIKPANIMLHHYPDPQFTAKVLDFGLAKLAVEMAEARKDEATIGSVYYISPEQLRHQPLSPSTDLYSIGHVFYHTLCSRVPFHEPDPVVVRNAHLSREPDRLHDIYAAIPVELSDWVHFLMAKDPGERPQSAQAALAALTPISMACHRRGLLSPAPDPQDAGTSLTSRGKRATAAIAEATLDRAKRGTSKIGELWNRIRGK